VVLVPPRVVVCADAARWGTHRCVRLIERLAPVAPPGAMGVWDRDPERDSNASSLSVRRDRLEALREATAEHGHPLIVGARVDLALAVKAEGVHLPEHGLDAEVVRRTFPQLVVSRSCHDQAGLWDAQQSGAAWATLSPFLSPRSKASTRAPLGAERFSQLIDGLSMPVVALGGLSSGDLESCRRAGAAGLALSGALFESAHPERLLESLISGWSKAL